MTGTVSVVIPVHNGEAYLAEAIDSVLDQSRAPTELIVVDDSSTDGSVSIARKYEQATVVRCEHRSAGEARNEGVRASSGDWLAFLDHDDVWLPDKLEKQADVLKTEPGVDIVLTRQESWFMDGVERPVWMAPELVTGVHTGFLPTMLVRRASFDRVGWFWNDACEDTEWHFRAMEQGLVMATVPQVLLRRRIHGRRGPVSRKQRAGMLRAVREHLARTGQLRVHPSQRPR